jgi:hypothetical protein
MSKLSIDLVPTREKKNQSTFQLVIDVGNLMFSSDQVDSYFHVVGKSSQYGLLELRRKISLYVSMICISQLRWVMRSDVKIYIKKGTQFHSVCDLFVCVCALAMSVSRSIVATCCTHTLPTKSQGKQYNKLSDGTSSFFSDLLVFQKR